MADEIKKEPDSPESDRQLKPQRETRPQAEKERAPDTYQRTQERDRSDSSWAGSSWGGRGR